jgi:hypothetical protein
MPQFPYDENMTLTWVTTIADTAAPTDDELNAGIDFSFFLPPDGFDPGFSDSQFSTSKIATAVDTEEQGRTGAKPKVTLYRDSVVADDDAYTTLLRKARGFWVKRLSTAVAAGSAYIAAQKVDIFPVSCGERKEKPSNANSAVMFESQGALYAPYKLDVAVVAAP